MNGLSMLPALSGQFRLPHVQPSVPCLRVPLSGGHPAQTTGGERQTELAAVSAQNLDGAWAHRGIIAVRDEKPRIRVRAGIWECGVAGGRRGYGYAPREAYADWRTLIGADA